MLSGAGLKNPPGGVYLTVACVCMSLWQGRCVCSGERITQNETKHVPMLAAVPTSSLNKQNCITWLQHWAISTLLGQIAQLSGRWTGSWETNSCQVAPTGYREPLFFNFTDVLIRGPAPPPLHPMPFVLCPPPSSKGTWLIWKA